MSDRNNLYTTLLLATFVAKREFLNSTVQRIFQAFQLENDKIFVFSDVTNPEKKILTYNIFTPRNSKVDINKVHHTIRINRKKESNTLYTINSLNKIIEHEIGKLDPSHKIKWENYENSLLLYDQKDGLVITPTVLFSIVTKDKFYKTQEVVKIGAPTNNNFSSPYSRPASNGPRFFFRG